MLTHKIRCHNPTAMAPSFTRSNGSKMIHDHTTRNIIKSIFYLLCGIYGDIQIIFKNNLEAGHRLAHTQATVQVVTLILHPKLSSLVDPTPKIWRCGWRELSRDHLYVSADVAPWKRCWGAVPEERRWRGRSGISKGGACGPLIIGCALSNWG